MHNIFKKLPSIKASTGVTTAQMREVDRLMIEYYKINLVQMMENAGRHLADLAWRLCTEKVADNYSPQIVIACGNGNNGGGGLVAARYLFNWGGNVKIILVDEIVQMKPVPSQRLVTLQKLGMEIISADDSSANRLLASADLIIDAIIGYGLAGDPRGNARNLIHAINESGNSNILALDTPSGLDTTSGILHEPVVKALATLTLAVPKVGLLETAVGTYTGQLLLADIGVPRQLYKRMGLSPVLLFDNHPIVVLENDLI